MNRETMLNMLKEGYTPEYVSLVKWREVRRDVISGISIICINISNDTCALCEAYNNDCYQCTLTDIYERCTSQTSAWSKVHWSTPDNVVTNVTNMINHLQVLVAMYGVRNKYPEIDRFYFDEADVIVGEDKDEVVLLVEGYDIPPANRFPKDTPRYILEQHASDLICREQIRGL